MGTLLLAVFFWVTAALWLLLALRSLRDTFRLPRLPARSGGGEKRPRVSAVIAGRMTLPQLGAAVAAGVLLWGFYFAVGFRAFSKGMQANGLGSLLTIGLPLGVYALIAAGWPTLEALLPPGSVYSAAANPPVPLWAVGPAVIGGITLWMARRSLHHCDAELRRSQELAPARPVAFIVPNQLEAGP